MLREIKEIWAAGRQNLTAALSPLVGWRPLFSTAYPSYQPDGKEFDNRGIPFIASGTEGRVLDLFQNFFDSLAGADHETLLPVCGRYLAQLAGARAVFFAAATGSRLDIHCPGNCLETTPGLREEISRLCLQAAAAWHLPATEVRCRPLPGRRWRRPRTWHLSRPTRPVTVSDQQSLWAVFAFDHQGSSVLSSRQQKLIHYCLQHLARRQAEIGALNRLQASANRDPLTGVYNRRFFAEILHRESERASRYHQPVALIMADIDHFKQINDQRGHLAGDQVLRQFAALLAEKVRTSDLVCRYGGEEFAIILPQTSLAAARQLAERLRLDIAGRTFRDDREQPLRLTASLGVACWSGHGFLDHQGTELIQAADQALYQAKETGRNRTCTGSPAGLNSRR